MKSRASGRREAEKLPQAGQRLGHAWVLVWNRAACLPVVPPRTSPASGRAQPRAAPRAQVARRTFTRALQERGSVVLVPGGQAELVHTWRRTHHGEVVIYARHKGGSPRPAGRLAMGGARQGIPGGRPCAPAAAA